MNIWIDFQTFIHLFNIATISILITSFFLMQLVNLKLNLKYVKLMINELDGIIKKTKLPKKLPKVIYVYTTHNDFFDVRILQNMKQTYQNIEYWISDGSSDKECSKKIKAFAKKHNINYHSLKRSSVNKADNLNHFLKHANVKYDYLLISDADVAIDKNFVTNAVKIFCSENNNDLGYITSLLVNYPGNNYFQNTLLFIDNQFHVCNAFKILFNRTSSNLYSSSCLISREMLEKVNFFPDTNLEDWALEIESYKNMYSGIILSTNISLQEFDSSMTVRSKRISRIIGAQIKYIKENLFKNFNLFYKNVITSSLWNLLFGFWIIIGFFIATIFVWQILINWSANSYSAIILASVLIGNVIINLIGQFIIFRKLNYQNNNFFTIFILQFFFWIVEITNIFKTWFKALFLSKYVPFDKKRINNKCQIIRISFLWIISLTSICIVNLLFFYWFDLYWINEGWKYFCVLLNMIFFVLMSYSFSFIVLYLAGKKKTKVQYRDKEFIYCENQMINELQEECLEVRKNV